MQRYNGHFDGIRFGYVNGKKRAFLIQNMCPVKAEYIDYEYRIENNTKSVRIDEKFAKLLKKRNVFNICCINEAREVLENVRITGEAGNIQCPTLLFSSNGEDQEREWVENQQKFAAIMGAIWIPLFYYILI